ncbi:MAG: VanZ family protein [Clostridia bacterium]|nr:VanZ family protein [Clostridia bacterium]MBR2878263.1 VanZ family protein [Clostridia bacterium]
MNKKAVIFWVLTILIMAVIFHFSSQTAVESTDTSNSFSEKIIRLLQPITNIAEEDIPSAVVSMDGAIRILAHYSVFLLLGTVCYLAAYFTKDMRHIYKSLYSVGICTAYAISDEIHQYFVPGRSLQISDILTDIAGVITGTLIVIGIIVLIKRKKASE